MLATYLRTLARRGQYGQPRTPATIFVGESYTAFYWENHGTVPDFPTWQRVAALSARYQRFVRYMREVVPGWTEIRREYFADNSIESVQVARNGQTRRVLVEAPHGDVC